MLTADKRLLDELHTCHAEPLPAWLVRLSREAMRSSWVCRSSAAGRQSSAGIPAGIPAGTPYQRSLYLIGDHGSPGSSATAAPLSNTDSTASRSSASSGAVSGAASILAPAPARNEMKDASSVTGGPGRDGTWLPPVHLTHTRSWTFSRCRVGHSQRSCQLTGASEGAVTFCA